MALYQPTHEAEGQSRGLTLRVGEGWGTEIFHLGAATPRYLFEITCCDFK